MTVAKARICGLQRIRRAPSIGESSGCNLMLWPQTCDVSVQHLLSVQHQSDLTFHAAACVRKWSSPMLCFDVTADDDGSSG